MPWRGPEYEGDFPSLGWQVLDWAQAYFQVPDGPLAGQPLVLTDEQAVIIVRFYQLDDKGDFVFRRAAVRRAQGWGKALALDTLVPTPSGWTTMGRLSVGDEVFDERGVSSKVLAKSRVWFDTDCWRVTFSDGESVVASGDHLWTAQTRERKGYPTMTVDTRTLAERVVLHGARNWRIPMPGPLDLPTVELPLDPYVLGVWLGDGERRGQRVTSADPQILDEVAAAGFTVRKLDRLYGWSILKIARPLRAAGVFDRKHIPAAYLRASFAQRLALVQGLMDTDGSVYDGGVCEFTNTNPEIIGGMRELLASLGVKFSVYSGLAKINGRVVGPKWRIKFTVHTDLPVFRLERKQRRLRPATKRRALHRNRRILSVEPVATVPTVCIEVDSPSSLFLVGERMVPTHNSPMLGLVGLAELCGPCRFDGWDASGEPVGVEPTTPWVQVAASSEDQAANTYNALYEMAAHSELNGPVLDVGKTKVLLANATGTLEPVSAAAGTRLGQRVTFCVLDESHLWTKTNGGHKLAAVLRRNAAKMGGRTFESTNAHEPGEDSVAERTYEASKRGAAGLLYDSVEGPYVEDLGDVDAVLASLKVAYGDAKWVDLNRIASDVADPGTDPDDARRFFFNQLVQGSGRPVDIEQWRRLADPKRDVPHGSYIGVGFDGSINDDSTCLYGCTEDGHIFEIKTWERPENADEDWHVPRLEVTDAVKRTFANYKVGRMLCDPPHWWTEIETWAQRYPDYKRKPRVLALDTFAPRRFAPACGRLMTGVREGTVSHDGGEGLTLHLAACQKKKVRINDPDDKDDGRTMYVVTKADTRKIDRAVAAILALEAATTMERRETRLTDDADDDDLSPEELVERLRREADEDLAAILQDMEQGENDGEPEEDPEGAGSSGRTAR